MTRVGRAPEETEGGLDGSGGCPSVDCQELKGSRLRLEVGHCTFWVRLRGLGGLESDGGENRVRRVRAGGSRGIPG